MSVSDFSEASVAPPPLLSTARDAKHLAEVAAATKQPAETAANAAETAAVSSRERATAFAEAPQPKTARAEQQTKTAVPLAFPAASTIEGGGPKASSAPETSSPPAEAEKSSLAEVHSAALTDDCAATEKAAKRGAARRAVQRTPEAAETHFFSGWQEATAASGDRPVQKTEEESANAAAATTAGPVAASQAHREPFFECSRSAAASSSPKKVEEFAQLVHGNNSENEFVAGGGASRSSSEREDRSVIESVSTSNSSSSRSCSPVVVAPSFRELESEEEGEEEGSEISRSGSCELFHAHSESNKQTTPLRAESAKKGLKKRSSQISPPSQCVCGNSRVVASTTAKTTQLEQLQSLQQQIPSQQGFCQKTSLTKLGFAPPSLQQRDGSRRAQQRQQEQGVQSKVGRNQTSAADKCFTLTHETTAATATATPTAAAACSTTTASASATASSFSASSLNAEKAESVSKSSSAETGCNDYSSSHVRSRGKTACLHASDSNREIEGFSTRSKRNENRRSSRHRRNSPVCSKSSCCVLKERRSTKKGKAAPPTTTTTTTTRSVCTRVSVGGGGGAEEPTKRDFHEDSFESQVESDFGADKREMCSRSSTSSNSNNYTSRSRSSSRHSSSSGSSDEAFHTSVSEIVVGEGSCSLKKSSSRGSQDSSGWQVRDEKKVERWESCCERSKKSSRERERQNETPSSVGAAREGSFCCTELAATAARGESIFSDNKDVAASTFSCSNSSKSSFVLCREIQQKPAEACGGLTAQRQSPQLLLEKKTHAEESTQAAHWFRTSSPKKIAAPLATPTTSCAESSSRGRVGAEAESNESATKAANLAPPQLHRNAAKVAAAAAEQTKEESLESSEAAAGAATAQTPTAVVPVETAAAGAVEAAATTESRGFAQVLVQGTQEKNCEETTALLSPVFPTTRQSETAKEDEQEAHFSRITIQRWKCCWEPPYQPAWRLEKHFFALRNIKVHICLSNIGGAARLRVSRFKMDGYERFEAVLKFLTKALKKEKIYVYINNFVQPQPDEFVADLYRKNRDASASALVKAATAAAAAEIMQKVAKAIV